MTANTWDALRDKFINSCILKSLNDKNSNIFDILTKEIDDHFYNLKSRNMTELKQNKAINKQKGTLFEDLVMDLILNNIILKKHHISFAWKFEDIPNHLKQHLRLWDRHGKVTKKDMGIDIVAYTRDKKWMAIQCKYIMKPIKRRVIQRAGKTVYAPWMVGHAKLSTFFALCYKTGPGKWDRRVVITNCPQVNYQGEKEKQVDISVCKGTFCKITREEWLMLVGDVGNKLNESRQENVDESTENNDEKEKLRQLRNKWLDANFFTI
jgi:hypothetical protein